MDVRLQDIVERMFKIEEDLNFLKQYVKIVIKL